MRFLVDNQLPGAELCRYATANKRILMSKDEDFLYLASGPKTEFQFLWVWLGNCRTAALLKAFEQVWPRLEASLSAGERVVEIR